MTACAYEDGQEQGANWFTQYATGVLNHHERDEISDRIVADRVYEMAAAQAVGKFLRVGAREADLRDAVGPQAREKKR